MNNDHLLAAIRDALASGITTSRDETIDVAKGYTYGAHIRTCATVSPGQSEPVMKLARLLEHYDSTKWIFDSNYLGNCLIPWKTANWLLAKSLRTSPEEALNRLANFAGTNTVPGNRVMLIYGACVDQEVVIDSQTRLVPLWELQPSLGRDNIVEEFKPLVYKLHVTRNKDGMFQPAVCALIQSAEVSPALTPPGAPVPSWQDYNSSPFKALEDLTYALTLLPSTIPHVVSRWHEPRPFDAIPGLTGGQFPSIELMEVIPAKRFAILELLSITDACSRLSAYQRLSLPIKRRLSIPLRRLALARARRNVGDRAIEVCIALEAIFGGSERSEIIHKVAVRSAGYFNELIDCRRRRFHMIKKVYDIRSKIVHGDSIDEAKVYEVAGTKISVPDIVDSALEFARLAANKIVDECHFPKLEDLDLGDL